MIKNLRIKNFKSIKDLEISCKKLNVFIGEPNSGKSNIIEALALQSQNLVSKELNKDLFRYKSIGDLFFDFNINEQIEIITNERHTILKYSIRDDGTLENQFHLILDINQEEARPIQVAHDGNILTPGDNATTNVLLYEYKRLPHFINSYLPHLAAPFGENLPSLLLSNAEYKKWVSELLNSKGMILTLKPAEFEILVSKFIDDEIYSYPYFSLSETMQRIIFYNLALKSNKNATLLFDEPDSNTFPLYTKLLAERIALDPSNQFFISTHNPYLLLSLIEKSKSEDLNVCIVQMKDYQTSLSVLGSDQISEVLDLNSDIFFNFDKVLEQ